MSRVLVAFLKRFDETRNDLLEAKKSLRIAIAKEPSPERDYEIKCLEIDVAELEKEQKTWEGLFTAQAESEIAALNSANG